MVITRRFSALTKRSRGFTILEMVFVVAIIAILAGVLLFKYPHVLAESSVSSIMMQDRQIATALESYNADKGVYPASATITTANLATMFGAASNQFLNAAPSDGGSSYVYTLTTNDYNVCSGKAHDFNAESGLQDFATNAAPTSNEFVCYSPSRGPYTAASSAGI